MGFKNSSFEHFGERALLENKEQREIKARLQRIEDELAKLHNPEEIEVNGSACSPQFHFNLTVTCLSVLFKFSLKKPNVEYLYIFFFFHQKLEILSWYTVFTNEPLINSLHTNRDFGYSIR